MASRILTAPARRVNYLPQRVEHHRRYDLQIVDAGPNALPAALDYCAQFDQDDIGPQSLGYSLIW